MYTLSLTNNTSCHYELVASKRAKYIRLKISPDGEVKVVVPHYTNHQLAHDFVKQRRDWIQQVLEEIQRQPVIEVSRPGQLKLRCIHENWKVSYQTSDYQGIVLTPNDDDKSLHLEGMTDDNELIFDVLTQWLKNRAKHTFPKMLDEIASECGFHYNRVTIRGQKTRWGSCSSKKNINLNYKLLFFPTRVAHYVFIHELCHTLEMNHSQHFWSQVQRCDPDYQQHRLILKKQAEEYLPAGF